MSLKTHSTTVVNLDNIFVTGLVPGGYDKASHDVQMSPTCRFSNRSYGLGKASDASDAVIVMNKSRTCKTSELCQSVEYGYREQKAYRARELRQGMGSHTSSTAEQDNRIVAMVSANLSSVWSTVDSTYGYKLHLDM